MSKWQELLPVKAEPDFNNLLKVLQKKKPDRPTLFEFIMNREIENLLFSITEKSDPEKTDRAIVKTVAMKNAGYDFMTWAFNGFSFHTKDFHSKETLSLNEGSAIRDRESFDKFIWPEVGNIDVREIEVIQDVMPDGMKAIIWGPGGVLENVIKLSGYETICLMMYDDPLLVQDIFDRVGQGLVDYYSLAASLPYVGACMSNDDWGYKTQTMLSTEQMRKYVFPWHKKIVEVIHAQGKPATLHSCGMFRDIIDDIIDDMNYDGRHSYEDTIIPVEQAYDLYHQRIAILGGIDVDYICKTDPQKVYERSKAMLKRSDAEGSYALGSGNSITPYIPHDGYLAMISAVAETR